MESKICTKCKVEKHLSEFYRQKTGHFGVTAMCKLCHSTQHKSYYSTNKEKINRCYNVNKEKILAQKKIYYQNNIEKLSIKSKKYYEANVDKIKIQQKIYCESNKTNIKIQ